MEVYWMRIYLYSFPVTNRLEVGKKTEYLCSFLSVTPRTRLYDAAWGSPPWEADGYSRRYNPGDSHLRFCVRLCLVPKSSQPYSFFKIISAILRSGFGSGLSRPIWQQPFLVSPAKLCIRWVTPTLAAYFANIPRIWFFWRSSGERTGVALKVGFKEIL